MIDKHKIIKILNAIVLCIVPICFGLYSLILGQDTNFDLRNYHLYNPYAFLNNRLSFDLAPSGLQTYLNPFLDVVYFFAISHLRPRTVGFLIGFIQGLNFILVYSISNHVLNECKWKNVYSLILAMGGLLSVGFLSEVGTILNDSMVAVILLMSLWMIISSVDKLEDDQRSFIPLLMCSGILAGIGCALKLTTSIYALAMCLAFFALPVRWDRKIKMSFLFGLSVLLGLLVAGGYWMFEVWSLFGNPLFPMFNNIFHGPLAEIVPMRDLRFLPNTFFEKVFYPALFTVNPGRVSELKYEQVSWLFAYVAVLALLTDRFVKIFKKDSDQCSRNSAQGFLLAFFCISYVLWLNIFGIYRYLILAEILIPLLLFIAVNYFFRTSLACWGTIFFIIALTVFNLRGVPDWGHSAWAEKIYRVESNTLTMDPKPAAVYFVGGPLAWLVPALDINAPVIGLASGMPVSEDYWRRTKELVAGRDGKSFLILESDTPDVLNQAKNGLANLGLGIKDNSCDRMVAYLGTAKFEYRYCEVSKVVYAGDIAGLKIKNWGPRSMVVGNIPNKQPDGVMGIWILASGVPGLGKVEVLFDGQPAITTVSKKGMSAAIAPERLTRPGKKEVAIRQFLTGKTFPVGVFELQAAK
ncbi:MAG: hypothetical protein NTW65_04590 [Deltaproteobacteria bacterium]|nr:hypothetical protein [Deltaproteobacteria bacterium]